MTTFTVVDDLAPLVDGTDWAEVELTEGRGRGIAVWFALAPSPTGADPIAALERLTARPDPLLAPVAEYGVDDGEGYVVWSGTLDETLAALSGPLTMAEIVSLADVVLAGFERLHAAGFVHPRLGPDVVRLVPDDEGRVVPEVLGFGLPWGDRTTRDDLVDIGHLLYRLYTGRDAYEVGQPTDGSIPPPSFASARPGVVAPVAFETAVLRAIGPRERRFITAGEMRAALAVGPGRRTGFAARPTATTDPHMRRALTSGMVGLEALLTPEALPAPEDRLAPAPSRGLPRSLGLVPALGIAAATLVVGFLIGRATGGSSPDVTPSTIAAAAPLAVHSSPGAPSGSHPETRVAAVGEALGGAATKLEVPVAPAPGAPGEPVAKPAAPDAKAPAVAQAAGVTRLEVVSDPPGATVLVRGKKIVEKTPFTIEVTPEWLPIELVFDKRKHHPRREFVEALTGPSMSVNVKLRPR